MKRDMELVRKILIWFDDYEDTAMVQDLTIDGYIDLQVKYHLKIMAEGGLIDVETEVSSTTPSRVILVHPFGLTWAGHDFVDSIRDESIWKTVKTKLSKVGGVASLTVVNQLLIPV